MAHARIVVVVGSLRKDSINRKLARALEKLAPSGFQFEHADIRSLPLYDQDDDASQAESVVRLKELVSGSQGLLFVTPEYNRSIPGVLKNALDHASRPYGKNAWAGKPGGVIGASIGAAGSAMAQQHLRNVLAYLDVPLLGQPEAFIHVKDDTFDASGELANDGTRKFLQKWIDAYAAFVKQRQG
jgi:chromate reductase, NAD(P)H dehydrogenase (quinone)